MRNVAAAAFCPGSAGGDSSQGSVACFGAVGNCLLPRAGDVIIDCMGVAWIGVGFLLLQTLNTLTCHVWIASSRSETRAQDRSDCNKWSRLKAFNSTTLLDLLDSSIQSTVTSSRAMRYCAKTLPIIPGWFPYRSHQRCIQELPFLHSD